MEKNVGFLIGSIILAVALVVSVLIMKDAYLNKNVSQSIPYINANVSGIEKALSNNDSMMLYDFVAYIGGNTSNLEPYQKEIEENKFEGLPFIKINGIIVFSKRAVNQWLYDSSLKRYEVLP
jgi:hypothetical protein